MYVQSVIPIIKSKIDVKINLFVVYFDYNKAVNLLKDLTLSVCNAIVV